MTLRSTRSLMYHDLTGYGESEESGFRNAWAGSYKIAAEEFRRHLNTISRAGADVGVVTNSNSGTLFITFDDGGTSSLEAARLLEEHGWRGHFFISTDYIGQPGFLAESQIRELFARGHIIGTHSCSHPLRMSSLDAKSLAEEWRRSRERLADAIGCDVTVGSVPGGYYSRAVGEAASESGLRHLFCSEPVERWQQIGECALIGRYYVQRAMTANQIHSFITGGMACRKQWLSWNVRKAAKRFAPSLYVGIASRLRR